MNPYLPVLIVLAFGVTLGGILSALSVFMGPRKPNRIKSEVYECGVPLVTGASEKMSVKFYLTGILFILFDIETIFLYLWAIAFDKLGWFGLIEITLFMTILVVGFVYVLNQERRVGRH